MREIYAKQLTRTQSRAERSYIKQHTKTFQSVVRQIGGQLEQLWNKHFDDNDAAQKLPIPSLIRRDLRNGARARERHADSVHVARGGGKLPNV